MQYIVGLTGNKFASTDRKTEPEYDYEGVEPIYTELYIWNLNSLEEPNFVTSQLTYDEHSLIQLKGTNLILFSNNGRLTVFDIKYISICVKNIR